MEQRLRLVQGGHQPRTDKRTSERHDMAVPGQIVWKDAKGNTKLTSVMTRNVSENGVAVECLNGAAIPLYRLVYFQVDREARHRPGLPEALRKPNVLSAIFRVGEDSRDMERFPAAAIAYLVPAARTVRHDLRRRIPHCR